MGLLPDRSLIYLIVVVLALVVVQIVGTLFFGLVSGPGLNDTSLSTLFSKDNFLRSLKFVIGGAIFVVLWFFVKWALPLNKEKKHDDA